MAAPRGEALMFQQLEHVFRQLDQIGRSPSAGGVPPGLRRVARGDRSGNVKECVVAYSDVTTEIAEAADSAERVERWIEESQRPAGVLAEIGHNACPLRRAFAGSANAVIARV